jgi:hypothetical protein
MHITTAIDGCFAVALRLSQPWYPDTIRQLHDAALFNAHFLYDTIAWDTIYPAPAGLTETWSFLAQHSDALIYISDFTRERFRIRFPAAASLPDHVCCPSLDPDDYVRTQSQDAGYLLIAGNEYDHKGVPACLETLQAAFPQMQLRVTGAQDKATGDVPNDCGACLLPLAATGRGVSSDSGVATLNCYPANTASERGTPAYLQQPVFRPDGVPYQSLAGAGAVLRSVGTLLGCRA